MTDGGVRAGPAGRAAAGELLVDRRPPRPADSREDSRLGGVCPGAAARRDELDRLKRDNQARSRARTALKTRDQVFRNVSEERPMGRLRDRSSPGLGPVTMELLFDPT
jgi:hypothetical protein